jgi:hypothetical protein
MNIVTHIAYVVLVILLSACGSTQKLPSEAKAQAKRIGVVSQIGDSLNKQFVGLTVFGNERDFQDISQWGLDAVYEEQLAAAAKSVFNAEIVLLGNSRADFVKVNTLNGPYSAPIFWGPNFDAIAEITKITCLKNELDAILVVTKLTVQGVIDRTNQVTVGIGIQASRGTATAYIFSKIGYLDCKSEKILASSDLQNADTTKESVYVPRRLTFNLGSELGGSPFSTWTRVDKARVWEIFSSLPTAAWVPTLKEMLPAQ